MRYKLLEDRILQDGKCYAGGILKVDSFINHQMDPDLMMSIGKKFSEIFSNKDINKILTIEASGIAPAIMMGSIMHLPVVFAKKKSPRTMDNMLVSKVHSFTKNRTYSVCLSQDFLTPEDRVAFIDDFLAYGNAARGIIDICRQAGAEIAGMGFIIEKVFQGGGEYLKSLGIDVYSLARIKSLEGNQIVLE